MSVKSVTITIVFLLRWPLNTILVLNSVIHGRPELNQKNVFWEKRLGIYFTTPDSVKAPVIVYIIVANYIKKIIQYPPCTANLGLTSVKICKLTHKQVTWFPRKNFLCQKHFYKLSAFPQLLQVIANNFWSYIRPKFKGYGIAHIFSSLLNFLFRIQEVMNIHIRLCVIMHGIRVLWKDRRNRMVVYPNDPNFEEAEGS